jgi:Hsp70 protein
MPFAGALHDAGQSRHGGIWMGGLLGLSIGATNFAVDHGDGQPVMRRSVLTLSAAHGPQLGSAARPSPGDLVLRGFVDRVGDPIPLIADDGSPYRPELLVVEALATLVHSRPTDVAIAVPAHWDSRQLGLLRNVLRAKLQLCPGGSPPPLISDATAALTALQHTPGLPARGVVALVDCGGSGTSLTLADAAGGFTPVCPTVRHLELAGHQIDQTVLARVLADITEAADMDPTRTGAVGALGVLREQCRTAKEALSADTIATVDADLPGYRSSIRLTRDDLNEMIAPAVAGAIAALADLLARNGIAVAELAAVAAVGGGAAIPLLIQRLSEQFRTRVVTAPLPALAAARGAALIAARGPAAPATTMTPATGVAALAAAGAVATASVTLAAAAYHDADNPTSEKFQALAWSEDTSAEDAAVESGPSPAEHPETSSVARPQLSFLHEDDAEEPEADKLAWYRRPVLLLGVAMAAVLLTGGGLAYTLTSKDSAPAPAPAAPGAPAAPVAAPPPPPPAPAVVPPPVVTTVRNFTDTFVQSEPVVPAAPRTVAPEPEATSASAPPETTSVSAAPSTSTSATPVTSSSAPTSQSAVSSSAAPVTTQTPTTAVQRNTEAVQTTPSTQPTTRRNRDPFGPNGRVPG